MWSASNVIFIRVRNSQELMTRNRSIDAFRGLAILGMVFFTLTLALSSDLPDWLRHNVRGAVHLGDFVLPMFIFASGLSLAYYLAKRENWKKGRFVRDVAGRFCLLALIGILLSPFSAGGFLEMDEVMLIALLFLACVVLSRLDWKINLIIIFLVNISYLAFIQPDWADTGLAGMFSGHYLGGYAAAPFYLTVMLVGLLIGKGIIHEGLWCDRNKVTIALASFFFFAAWAFNPVDKLAVSPSFMMMAVLFCFAIYAVVDRVVRNMHASNELEYLGRKPIRYWIMMYVFVLIPLTLYVEHTASSRPDLQWPLSVIISICVMLLLWLASRSTDYFRYKKQKIERNAHP